MIQVVNAAKLSLNKLKEYAVVPNGTLKKCPKRVSMPMLKSMVSDLGMGKDVSTFNLVKEQNFVVPMDRDVVAVHIDIDCWEEPKIVL